MAGGMSRVARRELLASLQERLQGSSKKHKGRILDEFIAVTGHHRKHGIRLLVQSGDAGDHVPGVKGRRIYDEAVREAVILVWEASDRICGKRLKAASEGSVAPPDRVHGTTRTYGPGPRGEGTPIDRQRGHPGPTAQAHQDHGGQPAETPP